MKFCEIPTPELQLAYLLDDEFGGDRSKMTKALFDMYQVLNGYTIHQRCLLDLVLNYSESEIVLIMDSL